MLSYRRCVLGFLVLCLCGYSSSEATDSASETAPSTPAAGEQIAGDDGGGKGQEEVKGEGGEGAEKQKMVVAFVPDYPSKISHPGMLANTSHFIMFYASWCSHSEAAMPEFKAALQYVVDRNMTALHLGKIEITQNGDIVKNFRIRATPSFIMYHRGARYVFEGEATSQNLIDFLQRVMVINLTEVSSARELSALRRDHPVVFLLVHDGQTDPDWHYAYSIVAQEKGLMAQFAFTTKTDLVQDFNVTKFPTIFVLKDGKGHRFSDSLSTYNIGKWVTRERHPAFPTVDEETFRPYVNLPLGRRLAILLVHEDPSQQRITEKRLIDTVRRVAESRKLFPYFQFVQLTSVPLAERMFQSKAPEVPYLFVYDPLSGQYYPFQPEEDSKGVTESAVKDFCNAVKKGKIEARGGGWSLGSVLNSWWVRLQTISQAMATHYPRLSIIACLSLSFVFIFYTVIWLRRPHGAHQGRKGRRTRAAAAAARSKAAKRRRAGIPSSQSQRQQNGSAVKRRPGRGKEDEEEMSENDLSHDSSSSEEDQAHRHKS